MPKFILAWLILVFNYDYGTNVGGLTVPLPFIPGGRGEPPGRNIGGKGRKPPPGGELKEGGMGRGGLITGCGAGGGGANHLQISLSLSVSQ